MSDDWSEIREFVNPYVHRRIRRRRFIAVLFGKVKTKVINIWRQTDGDEVWEIRIHKSKLDKLNRELRAFHEPKSTPPD